MPYSAAQIVTLATQVSRTPGYTAQAGEMLNAILADLCQQYDFDFIRQTTTLNIGPGSAYYVLPADHYRTREVFYNVQGTIFFLYQIPLEDYDQAFAGPGVNNYPQSYAVDVAADPNNMYFWPPPAISLSVTVRYQPQKADITTPESSSTVPWFPNQRYLIKKLAADLMMLSGDKRMNEFEKDAQEILKNFLSMDDDKENYAQTVKLDGRRFRGSAKLRPTKVTGI
jgi:hypothetical protein